MANKINRKKRIDTRLDALLMLSERDRTFDADAAFSFFRKKTGLADGSLRVVSKEQSLPTVSKEQNLPTVSKVQSLPTVNKKQRLSIFSRVHYHDIIEFLLTAAAVIAVVLACYFTYRYFTPADIEVKVPDIMATVEVETPNGSTMHITLADGTGVWLNAGSKISYDTYFGRTNRNVKLDGEAYFEVSENKALPFVVQNMYATVRVLGTRFDVNAYPDNGQITVVLLEGLVNLTAGHEHTLLHPHQKACYDKTTHTTQVVSAQENTMRWIEGGLVFNGETFEEIIRTLERKFDVKITISNVDIRERRFAGDFTNDETLAQILQIMSVNGKFKYQISNKNVTIY